MTAAAPHHEEVQATAFLFLLWTLPRPVSVCTADGRDAAEPASVTRWQLALAVTQSHCDKDGERAGAVTQVPSAVASAGRWPLLGLTRSFHAQLQRIGGACAFLHKRWP